MKNTVGQDTALKIMNAAEVLFVEYGFAGTSMRMITEQAQVNLAAVNYHFGSKESLYQAVYDRRLQRFCEIALYHLDQVEATSPMPAVAAIVQAFLQAGLDMCAESEAGGFAFVRLLSRTFAESQRQLRQMRRVEYQVMATRYAEALKLALPQLGEVEILWRLHFLVTATFNAFAGNDVMRFFANHTVVNARDPYIVAKYLLPYLVAGVQAQASKPREDQPA
jgi:AcrR family transcriptional regulator